MKYGRRYSTPSSQPVRGESQIPATSTADTMIRMRLVFCFFVTAFTPPLVFTAPKKASQSLPPAGGKKIK